MTVLRPLPGHAPSVRVLADAVEQTGRRLAAAASDLAAVRDGAVWDGPAGDAFSARVQDVPGLLEGAARRHLAAVGPLRAWADTLEQEQAVAEAAITDYDEAQDAQRVLEDRLYALTSAGRDDTSPEVLLVHDLQRHEAATMARAEARHQAAGLRLAQEAARHGATLRALAEDGLGDSLTYRGLHAVSSTGHAVGTAVGPVATWLSYGKAAAMVGDGAGTLADGALLLRYDEGSWGEVAVGAAATAAGGLGTSLRAGARLGESVQVGGRVLEVASLSAQERFVLGLSQTARTRLRDARDAFRPPSARAVGSARGARSGGTGQAPRPAATAGSPGSARGVVHRAVASGVRTARAAQNTVRTELALVNAGGPTARRMYVSGITLQAGSRATPHLVPEADALGRRGTPR